MAGEIEGAVGDRGGTPAERLLVGLVEGKLDASLAGPFLAALEVVLKEAARNARFGRALRAAVTAPEDAKQAGEQDPGSSRRGRRAPGVIDPYAVLEEGGPPKLEMALADLTVDQLKDIIAEHGMDRDRLAMKWRDPARLVGRIVETVAGRASKGDAFRPEPDNSPGERKRTETGQDKPEAPTGGG